VLLMDEPLGALDRQLRQYVQLEIRRLHRLHGRTTIYVTHDQEEALVISDRICVMQGGHVHQVGTPWEVYAQPATLFVASFVGAMNVIADLPVGAGGTLALGAAPRPVPALAGRDRVTLAIRLEDMTLAGPADAASDALTFDGAVDKVSFAGREAFYRVRLDEGPQILAHVHRPERRLLEQAGARLRLILPLARLHMFDPVTGQRIEAAS